MIANLNSIGRELLDNQNQEEEDNTVGNYLEGLFNYDQLVSNPIQPTLQEIIQNKENNYMPTYSSRSDNYVFDDNFGSAGIKFDKAKNRWYSDDPLTNAFIMKESGGYADALSPTGASGLFQFTVGTARAMGLDPKDRTDPYKSYDAYVRLTSPSTANFSSSCAMGTRRPLESMASMRRCIRSLPSAFHEVSSGRTLSCTALPAVSI